MRPRISPASRRCTGSGWIRMRLRPPATARHSIERAASVSACWCGPDASGPHQQALTEAARSIEWRAVAGGRSLILIQPDPVQRRLAGEILGRIEARGFEIREAKLVTASRELGEEHYAEHREKPFFGELVQFITSGPTWALVVEGDGAIATMRATIGATDPATAR